MVLAKQSMQWINALIFVLQLINLLTFVVNEQHSTDM